MRTILVCGSRDWQDGDTIRRALRDEPKSQGWGDDPVRVIHGGCRGADELADRAARDIGYLVVTFLANWSERGRSAGPLRNARMLDEGPDLVMAFGRGRGTDGTVREAIRRGFYVKRFFA